MTEQGVGRVLVIGAGLGGLTLAHALVRAGIDVRVYEADDGSSERFQGYRIGLASPGMEALRASLPQRLYELVEVTSGSLTGPGLLFDEQLTVLSRDLEGRRRRPGRWTGRCCGGSCSVSWGTGSRTAGGWRVSRRSQAGP